jgi:antitoxin PrlF
MATLVVTSKGQITIPVSVRNALGIKASTRVELIQTSPNEFSLVLLTCSIKQLKGILTKPIKTVSIEDMNPAIEICTHNQ